MKRQTNQARARYTAAGFSLLEMIASIVVAAVAILVITVMARSMSRQLHKESLGVSVQDNARVAIDEIARTLRGAGSGTDYARGQRRFLHASGYTVALNANLQPLDDTDGTAQPLALDPGRSNAIVPLDDGDSYTPPRAYTTGAETIVLTLDSNRDGNITAADAADDEEEASDNPRDFVLRSFVYGNDGTNNVVESTGLAVLRGPLAVGSGAIPEPLFRYWVDTDNDATTKAVLHGDANADGKLSQTEIQALTPVPTGQLSLIERIDITATSEGSKANPHSDSYPSIVLHSSVSFRNRNTTAARISGKVFHDTNQNGVEDSGEVALPNVVVRCSNGYKTKTDTGGNYSFALTPGGYTITEVDPAGYSSTTPNNVPVNPAPGDYVEVNFGDRSAQGIGRILGHVYDDANTTGTREPSERGVEGVRVFLDTGVSTYTDDTGKYEFNVSTMDYTITEEDSTGYTSSTPNVVEVVLVADGDSVVVNFGDYRVFDLGIIEGVVYDDENNNGEMDLGEPGIPNVELLLDDEQATSTDAQGEYTFSATPGSHQVTEKDPPGYTSSTPNAVSVLVGPLETKVVHFGDIGQEDINFQEITLGNTDRALSIGSHETGEDNKNDLDFVLGTHYVAGGNDILTWWNGRKNSSTPNSALFSVNPDYQRTIDADVNSLAIADLDGDGRDDVITGLGSSTDNISVWLMLGTGSLKGMLPVVPTTRYTASLATKVNDLHVGKFDTDSYVDIVVGTRTGIDAGKLEIWHGSGGSSFYRDPDDIYATVPGVGSGFGEIVSLAKADFTGDGVDDIVVGARTSSSQSKVYLLVYEPGETAGAGSYGLRTSFHVTGQIQDVLALDMIEDDQGDIDIVLAVEFSNTTGRIEVWHNRGDNKFGFGEIPGEQANDLADPNGSPISLAAANVDNDIFPDILVGTRASASYTGEVIVYRAYGYLPSEGIVISSSVVGEVITMTTADFNKDGAPDLATGTRSSPTSGKVVIYFNQGPTL